MTRRVHITAAKHIFGYLKKSPHRGRVYTNEIPEEDMNRFKCFTDANFNTTGDYSRAGYIFMLNGAVASCKTYRIKRQVMSSSEAENIYIFLFKYELIQSTISNL